MLRGFVKPYKKLFDGEVFTTVRLHESVPSDMLGRRDVIGLYPRSKRYSRLGRAEILGWEWYETIGIFADFCTEEFAQYDGELSKGHFIISLTKQAKSRKLDNPWLLIYTYLWTEKEEGWSEAVIKYFDGGRE